MPLTAQDICLEACQDAQVLGPGEVLAGDIAANVLSRLLRILDNWNADQRFAYAERFDQFTITPSHNPHTLGPVLSAPDFVYPVRPVTLDAASVVDTSVSPNVSIGIALLDWQGYNAISVPGTTSPYEVAAYYEPAEPLGKLYLWPIPTTAYKIELWTKTAFGAYALTDTVTLPPGYRDALTLTLAESVAVLWEQQPSPLLIMRALEARRRAFGNNNMPLALATRDSGMPNAAQVPTFNFQTGLFSRSGR